MRGDTKKPKGIFATALGKESNLQYKKLIYKKCFFSLVTYI